MSIVQQFGQAAAVISAAVLWHVSLCAQEASSTISSSRDPGAVAAVEAAKKLISEQKYRDAIIEANRALKIDGAFAEAFVMKGNILKATEDYQGAAKAYSHALEIFPEAVEAYSGRGEALMAIGQFDEAIADFRKAQELDPNNAVVLSNLGHLLVNKAGDPTNGLRILSDAIALNGKDARAYRDRGLAHAQLRDFREAIADMQKAAEIDPDDLEEDRSVVPTLPPIDGGEVKVFRLQHADVVKTAEIVQSLFGVSQMRVAVDDRTNSLVVMGDKESLKIVEALLMKMDQPTDGAADGRTASPAAAAKLQARSLLLRVFWLADGLAEGEGQDPAAYLPPSVLEALKRLGLQSPRLVTQTVNSLAVRDAAEVRFATQVPAVLLGQHATLQCAGSMSPMNDDRTDVDVDIHVYGPAINCELKGSLATPLGHYMVLGTANSVIAEPMAMGGEMEMGGGGTGMRGEDGTGMMLGRGGEGGMMRGGEGGYVGEGGFGVADLAAVPGADGAMGMEAMAPQTPKYNTSRFAFVVQVIEGESFPAEE